MIISDFVVFCCFKIFVFCFSALPSSPPPVIERGHSNQTLMVGTTAVLPCQASGRSVPRISWLKNGKLIDLDDPGNYGRIQQSSTGTLQISESEYVFQTLHYLNLLSLIAVCYE